MNLDFMSNFRTQIGAYVWGIRLISGTILDIEFGSPKLFVRDNKIKNKLIGVIPPRKYSIHGDLQLTIENAQWELTYLGHSYLSDFIGSTDENRQIKYLDAVASCICGQILVDVSMKNEIIAFMFDAGGIIRVLYNKENVNQFMISIGDDSIEYPIASI